MVDDMVHFALTTFATGHDQAFDVLRSGLAAQADPEKGMQAGRWGTLHCAHASCGVNAMSCMRCQTPYAGTRLYLTMAELERDRSNWVRLAAPSIH